MNQVNLDTPARISFRKIFPYFILIFIILLSFYGWAVSNSFLNRKAHERFLFRVDEIARRIIERADDYIVVAKGASGLFIASDSVNRREWHDYAKYLNIDAYYPGIQGIGFIEYIGPNQLPEHIEKIRSEGFPEYAIRPEGRRDEYTSIIYLEPSDPVNQRVIGYDMLSDPVCRKAMEEARDSGMPRISGRRIVLKETDGDPQPGFVIFVPVFKRYIAASTVQERRSAILGYVQITCVVGNLIRGVLGDTMNDLDLVIYDGNETSENNLLYEGLSDKPSGSFFNEKRVIDVDGKQWVIVVSGLSSFLSASEQYQSRFILLFGFGIGLLAFFFFRSQERTREVALALAREMTSELREKEMALTKILRALRTISLCNEKLIRATEESEFIKDVCRIAVTEGGYAFAWVGLAEKDQDRTVKALAQEGISEGYLEGVQITYGDDLTGQGPTGTAIRTGKHQILKDVRDLSYAPWTEQAEKRGYRCTIALPLFVDGEIFGALSLYSTEPNDFDDDEVRLLTDLASDLGFGISTLRTRQLAERSLQALQRSETFLQQIVENIPNMIFVKDALDLRFVRFNKAGEELLGYSRQTLIGKNDFDFFPSEQANFFIEKDREVLRKGKLVEILEEEIDTNLKGKRILHTKKIPVLSSDQEPLFLLGISEDVTERKESEEKKLRLAAIVDSSDDAIIGVGLEGIISSWNKGAEKMFGYREHEVTGGPVTILAPEHLKDEVHGFLKKAYRGESIQHLETIRQRKDGVAIPVSLTVSPIVNQDGAIVGISAIIRDISDRIAAEKQREALHAQLLQAQKMEAIGTLAGGIAHDFNNILFAIIGNTELAMDEIPQGNPARQNLERVRKASRRAAEMVKQILTFSRQEQVQRKPLDAIPIVKEALKFLEATLPANIQIKATISPAPCRIIGDPTQLYQVLMNLCVNAIHAMKEKPGVLTVDLRSVLIDDAFAQGYDNLKPGNYLKLTVGDTGHGIPPEIIDRIFEPYFTTKSLGEGTGLGLSVVHGIVRGHDGEISVQSSTGQGTSFYVFLPIIDHELKPQDENDTEKIPAGSERILFVDDDPMLTEMVKTKLEKLGYQVVATTNPVEALESFRNAPDQFDAIFTDMRMPAMSGDELVRQVKLIRPDLPAIICTGSSQLLSSKIIQKLGVARVILKPISIAETARALRQALDKTR